MAKRYARLNWQNSPSTATPVNATNLNTMDKGIDDCDNGIEDINNRIVQTDVVNDNTKYPSSVVTYQHGQEIDTINALIDISGSYTAVVVFGSNAINGYYRTSMIPVLNCSGYAITITSAIAQNVKILDLSTVAVDTKNKLGFFIGCTDSVVMGRSVDIMFTLVKA